MKRKEVEVNTTPKHPARTPEGREAELISLAYDLAEERIRDKTASSAEIVHWLKLGSTKDRLEKEILELQKDLITAKAEALRATKSREEVYTAAVEAMKRYSGNGDEE